MKWSALLVLGFLGCETPSPCEVDLEVISHSGAPNLSICASLAQTAEERRRGLQGQAPMAPGEGLLIVFPVEGEVCITNAGVDFAIDAAFVDASRAIVAVESYAAQEDRVRCHAPVREVLELLQGSGVSVGDLLTER